MRRRHLLSPATPMHASNALACHSGLTCWCCLNQSCRLRCCRKLAASCPSLPPNCLRHRCRLLCPRCRWRGCIRPERGSEPWRRALRVNWWSKFSLSILSNVVKPRAGPGCHNLRNGNVATTSTAIVHRCSGQRKQTSRQADLDQALLALQGHFLHLIFSPAPCRATRPPRMDPFALMAGFCFYIILFDNCIFWLGRT